MTLSVEQFLSTSTDKASVKPPLIPPTDSGYLAIITGLDLKTFEYKKGDRVGQTGYRLAVTWDIQDDKVIEMMKAGNRTAKTTQSVMLNMTPEGSLAAENSQLKELREALDQNRDGQPWKPQEMMGRPAKVLVKHRVDDKGEQQEEVYKVGRA